MLIPVPPSKSITIKVMLVNTPPTAPKSDGETNFKTGPIKTPIPNNNNTSGIFFLLKIIAKRWAENTKIPKNIKVAPIVYLFLY